MMRSNMEEEKCFYNLKENLKSFRKKKEITQQELADIIGIKRGTYASYEEGTVLPPIDKLDMISIILNTSIDELIYL